MSETRESSQESVWQVVMAIPRGKVASYGQVASLAGIPAHARLVGRILSQLPQGTRLPWHRVVDSRGRISNPNRAKQREKLEAEGITLVKGRVNMRRYAWEP